MGRVERRQYRRRQSEAAVARALLLLAAAVIVYGAAGRLRGTGLQVSRVTSPTATPVAAAFDETAVTRDVVLECVTWYAIQTGVYASQDAAQAQANTYADRGAPGIVVHDGEKYRVFIAAFGDKSDASSVRARLEERQQVETFLYAWECAPVTLRLSGMAGQVDVAEAGVPLCLTAACQLRDAASLLDQGSMSAEAVLDLVAAIDAQYDTWLSAAAARFDKPYPPLIQGEAALGEAWREVGRTVRAAARQDATALSASLKCGAMTLYAQVVAMRSGLTDS